MTHRPIPVADVATGSLTCLYCGDPLHERRQIIHSPRRDQHMTKRDFEAIAYALRRSRPDHDDFAEAKLPHSVYLIAHAQWERTVRQMADELRGTNPRYDRQRFIDACERP